MIFAVTSLWLMVILLLAWAVVHLWSGIVRPKVVNMALLPGTLVAQMGRIIGLLVTGAKINNTALMEDGEKGDPATDVHYEPKVPVFGPIVVGLLPMLAIGTVIYLVLGRFGRPVVASIPHDEIATELPLTLAAFWDQSRGLVTLAEETLNAVLRADMGTWKTLLFAYLMVCLTVRMAPFAGNVRGHVGAVVAACSILALINSLDSRTSQIVAQAWPLISLTVGWLLLLAIISLLARGAVSATRMIAKLE